MTKLLLAALCVLMIGVLLGAGTDHYFVNQRIGFYDLAMWNAQGEPVVFSGFHGRVSCQNAMEKFLSRSPSSEWKASCRQVFDWHQFFIR